MSATHASGLETELRYCNEHRSELLHNAAGRFALVKSEALIGTFDAETEAIRHGYQTLGNIAFLVKQSPKLTSPWLHIFQSRSAVAFL